jgi:RNA polymerase sigma-70 factor (ECF subfamily)
VEEFVQTHEKLTVESIIQEYSAFIRHTLTHLGVCTRDVHDVEQEVLRGVDRRLSAFNPSVSVNPGFAVRNWLYSICERQAANHRRRRARRNELLYTTSELDSEAAAGPDSEQRFDLEQRKRILALLLEELDPQRRAVIVAYELEGTPMADIAAALSIPVNTAWNRLRLARADIRERWDRYERQRSTVTRN